MATLNNKVNPLTRNLILRQDDKAFAQQFQSNINFEPAFKWRGLLDNTPIILGSPALKHISIDPGNLLWFCVLEKLN